MAEKAIFQRLAEAKLAMAEVVGAFPGKSIYYLLKVAYRWLFLLYIYIPMPQRGK
jgi:hypothetical protein